MLNPQSFGVRVRQVLLGIALLIIVLLGIALLIIALLRMTLGLLDFRVKRVPLSI